MSYVIIFDIWQSLYYDLISTFLHTVCKEQKIWIWLMLVILTGPRWESFASLIKKMWGSGKTKTMMRYILIHEADPQSVVITIFTHTHVVYPSPSVRPSIPTFQYNFQVKIMIATMMGLAEWIIEDTCLVYSYF